MTLWRPDFDPAHLYFVTTTAVRRRNLFRRDCVKRLIVDSLDCMRLRGRFRLYCFVVMPNHVHAIVQCSAEDPLSDCLRDLKKHVSDRLVRQYRAEQNTRVLGFLESATVPGSRQKHKVWETGYCAKDVFSPDVLRRKMTYIHENPCQSHWNLADAPEDYVWSSARFYLLEEPAIIPIDNASPMLI